MMPRRNRPSQPVARPRRTGMTIHVGGRVHYLITLGGSRYLTRNPVRAMKVTSARTGLQGVA